MQKSKAQKLVWVLLAIGVNIALISGFLLQEGQLKRTLQNIAIGIILGAFLFFVIAFIFPQWSQDKPKNENNNF